LFALSCSLNYDFLAAANILCFKDTHQTKNKESLNKKKEKIQALVIVSVTNKLIFKKM